mmetsp:Transcript_16708/g.45982  ORF Transcript_16708/g.45982 Transcript_16708/m.45982 type:complete len:323 (-) Transcript_16708:3255-4223(-)
MHLLSIKLVHLLHPAYICVSYIHTYPARQATRLSAWEKHTRTPPCEHASKKAIRRPTGKKHESTPRKLGAPLPEKPVVLTVISHPQETSTAPKTPRFHAHKAKAPCVKTSLRGGVLANALLKRVSLQKLQALYPPPKNTSTCANRRNFHPLRLHLHHGRLLRLYIHHQVSSLQGIVPFHSHLSAGACHWCADHSLHFHGTHHNQLLPCGDLGTGLDLHFNDGASHGGSDTAQHLNLSLLPHSLLAQSLLHARVCHLHHTGHTVGLKKHLALAVWLQLSHSLVLDGGTNTLGKFDLHLLVLLQWCQEGAGGQLLNQIAVLQLE